jgi:branched-chain amino acid transport system ATP-binding protein
VRLDGESLVGRSIDAFARAGICHIPEGRGIFRSMTVRENLLLQSPPGDEEAAIAKAVEAFPVLGQRLAQLAGTLSGGEQQMLAISRAYLSNPRFVFLDEISLGLAPRIVDSIFEFLHRLADSGAALLLVEQYVIRALGIADFVFILNQGEIAFAGEPGELDEAEVFRTYVGADVA